MKTVLAAAVVLIVFKLALSDGGRHLQSLMLAQMATFLVLGAAWAAGLVRRVALGTGMAAVLAAVVLTTPWSVRIEASLRELLLWLMYGGIATLTAAALTDLRAVERFLDGLTLVAGWLCLIALLMFWGAGNPAMRWYSTFYWPNPFAGFLLLVLPLSVARALHARTLRPRVAHGIMSILLGVALVFTYSRGAWLAALAALALAVVLCRPASWRAAGRRIAVLAAGTAVAVGLLLQAVPSGSATMVAERAASVADPADTSIQGRLNFWRSALAVFTDHPLVGTGPGTFGAVHAAYQRDARFYSRDAHNLYLQFAAEMGVVGVAAGGILLASLLALWRRASARAGPDAQVFTAGIGAGLLGFLLHAGVDMDWSFPAIPAMAFALAGVLGAMVDRPMTAGQPGAPRRAWTPGVVLVLALAAGASGAVMGAHREFATGKEHARGGRWDQAVRSYGRAARWNPLAATYRGAEAAAWLQVAPPQWSVAEAALHRAIALDRMNASYPFQMARLILTRSADPSGAILAETYLRRALRLDPLNRPEAYRLLAHALQRQGRAREAVEIYDQALRLYVGRRLHQGMIYLLLWPEVVSLALDAADLAVRQGDLDRAATVLADLLAEDPDAAGAALRLSEVYLRAGRPGEAAAVLAAFAARHPDNQVVKAALEALR